MLKFVYYLKLFKYQTYMKIIFFLLSFFLINISLNSQELIKVFDETLTVNSKSNYGGNSHNLAEVILPKKTTAIIYRISIFDKGTGLFDTELIELLKQVGGAKISLATTFAEFGVKSNDNEAVDIHLFNNIYDATDFHHKKEGWSACKSQLNRTNCCVKTSEFLTNRIFFGFKNNNYMQGLDVRLEVVAILDTSLKYDYKYTYQITNGANKELNFLISFDGQNWENATLRNGYIMPINTEKNPIFFKINTDETKKSEYRLQPNERFKIIFNEHMLKWDLTKY